VDLGRTGVDFALGVDVGALASYRDSGVCDWSRDARLLHDCPKTETEALDPASLRDLIRKEVGTSVGEVSRRLSIDDALAEGR